MGEALAYFITWTTYGTWLPGDQRGWVDKHDAGPSVPIQSPDSCRKARSVERMSEAPFRLQLRARQAVHAAILQTARFRNWHVQALSVLSNHVHVVVTAENVSPDKVEGDFKAYATRRLKAVFPESGRRHWWTDGGSKRYLNDEASLLGAMQYVQDQATLHKPARAGEQGE
jgi:REP element-mobilizing transposase RayT